MDDPKLKELKLYKLCRINHLERSFSGQQIPQSTIQQYQERMNQYRVNHDLREDAAITFVLLDYVEGDTVRPFLLVFQDTNRLENELDLDGLYDTVVDSDTTNADPTAHCVRHIFTMFVEMVTPIAKQVVNKQPIEAIPEHRVLMAGACGVMSLVFDDPLEVCVGLIMFDNHDGTTTIRPNGVWYKPRTVVTEQTS